MRAKTIKFSILATILVIVASITIMSSIIQSATAGWWMPLNAGRSEGVVDTSGNNLYVSWGAKKGEGIAFFFRASTDNGKTFGPKISLVNSTDVRGGDMEGLDSNVYVVWVENKTGNSDIFFRKSSDSGATWSKPINLSNDVGNPEKPELILSDKNLYVGWENANSTSPQKEIFFISSNDNGEAFNSVVNLSNSTQTASEDFRIGAQGNHVGVFWWERAAAAGGKDQPAVKISNDSGKTFGDTVVLSNATTPIVDSKMSTER